MQEGPLIPTCFAIFMQFVSRSESCMIFPLVEIPAFVCIRILGTAISGFLLRSDNTSTVYSVPGRNSWNIMFSNLDDAYFKSDSFSIFKISRLPFPNRGFAITGNDLTFSGSVVVKGTSKLLDERL